MSIKMIFVDLDGTALFDVSTLTPRTIQAFQKIRNAGIIPVIATGRNAYEADFAVRKLGADGYFIAMNGLAVYGDYRSGWIMHESYMDEKAVDCIIKMLLKERFFFQAYAGERAYCETACADLILHCGMDEEQVLFYEAHQSVVNNLQKHMMEHKLKVNKFFVSIADTKRIPKLRSMISKINGVRTLHAGKHYVEILPENADKKLGVQMVCEKARVKKSEIMVIGDSGNDIGMFEDAGIKVAMGNACSALKEKADYIAPPNDADGVAWALETYIL